MNRVHPLLVVLMALLFLGTLPSGSGSGQCYADKDCTTNGEKCSIYGWCNYPCHAHSDCPAQRYCLRVDGAHSGGWCDELPDGQCKLDKDCPIDGQTCTSSGWCHYLCKTHSDCPAQRHCVHDEWCEELPEGQCKLDKDCPIEYQTCSPHGWCNYLCKTYSDCPARRYCKDGLCEGLTPLYCNRDIDCFWSDQSCWETDGGDHFGYCS